MAALRNIFMDESLKRITRNGIVSPRQNRNNKQNRKRRRRRERQSNNSMPPIDGKMSY